MFQVDPSRFFYPPVSDRVARAEIYLTTIGCGQYDANVRYPRTGHPSHYDFDWTRGRVLADFVLVWLTGGQGEIEFSRGGRVRLEAGDGFYICPGEWHRYRPDVKVGWQEHWLGLNGQHLHRLRRRGLLPQGSRVIDRSESAPWKLLFDALLEDVGCSPAKNRIRWGVAGLQILLSALTEIEKHRAESDGRPTRLIDRALEHIRNHAHRKMTVESLAAAMQVNRRTLERHFVNNGRQTPQSEITQARLKRAIGMLRNSEIPLKEVAYSCGFRSPKAMIFSFQRVYGIAPGQMRHRLLVESKTLDVSKCDTSMPSYGAA